MKTMALAKQWFSQEDATEYGNVDEEASQGDVWVVTFPDDDIPDPNPGTMGEGS